MTRVHVNWILAGTSGLFFYSCEYIHGGPENGLFLRVGNCDGFMEKGV